MTTAAIITGMHCRILADAGAYAGFGGALALGPTRMMAQGVYAIPAIRYDVAVVVTNTTPMGAFRGAGRPEAAELLERMMDIAAAELGHRPGGAPPAQPAPGLLRPRTRRSWGRPTTAATTRRRSTRRCAWPDYEKLRADQLARRAAGDRVQLGIGVALYVEVTAGGGGEFGAVTVHARRHRPRSESARPVTARVTPPPSR